MKELKKFFETHLPEVHSEDTPALKGHSKGTQRVLQRFLDSEDTGALERFRCLRIQRALGFSDTQDTWTLGDSDSETLKYGRSKSSWALRQSDNLTLVALYLDSGKSCNVMVSFFGVILNGVSP